jgi:hypothetical protein
MEIYSCYTGYNYNEYFSTVSFSNPTDGTALQCSDISLRGLTDEG